jgi:hypothetical protein
MGVFFAGYWPLSTLNLGQNTEDRVTDLTYYETANKKQNIVLSQ